MRRGLHAAGFRYRLHDPRLPGRPDLVLSRYRAVVLVHGCFWHGHDCRYFRLPETRRRFWRAKIAGNRARDSAATAALRARGWRVLVIWECALKGRPAAAVDGVIVAAAKWLRSGRARGEIRGPRRARP